MESQALAELEKAFKNIKFREKKVFKDEVNKSQSFPTNDPSLDEALLQEQQLKDKKLRGTKLQRERNNLPVFKSRSYILNQIRQNKVIIIAGETGSGKTTQVPQYILEDMIKNKNGSVAKIVVTQPRRISAITVAERVAKERDERLPSQNPVSVGFQIRHDSCLAREHASITFCTTGVLLQKLKSNPLLSDISHVILDEVHERDLMTDMLVTILRDILEVRNDLKLILMSASMDSSIFSKYFHNCPVVEVEGRSFPVKEYYLEDALKLTGFYVKGKTKSPQANNPAYTERYKLEQIQKLAKLENPKTNLRFVASLVQNINKNSPIDSGAILVFLTGWEEQEELGKLLENTNDPLMAKTAIFFLHSLVDMNVLRKAFDKCPGDIRKIILSTNIAETSVTIEDVVYVVDTGKIKISNFDPVKNSTTLMPEWVSRSNAKQRAGRAGRVRNGFCYHLFSKAKEESLAQFVTPEMLRTRLEEVILQIKVLKLGKAKDFLLKTVSPPFDQAINAAIKLLTDINALKPAVPPSDEEELTNLGNILSILPINPVLGKMVVLGAIFSCLDPILSIVGVLSQKDIFVLGQNKIKVLEIRKYFAGDSKSDHKMLANIINNWEIDYDEGFSHEFCKSNYLSERRLASVYRVKQQLFETLRSIKLVSVKTSDVNSYNEQLVMAIIVAGLYPNVGKMGLSSSINQVETKYSQSSIHVRSVNASASIEPNSLIVYYHKLNNKILDCTIFNDITPVHMFGRTLAIHDDGITDLRMTIDKYLDQKMKSPWVSKWNDRFDPEIIFLQKVIEIMLSKSSRIWSE